MALDEFVTATQVEVKKALRSRVIRVIDDVLMRLKIEQIVMEDKMEHEKPLSFSDKSKYKVLRLHIDLLQKRINAVVKLNYDKAKQRHAEKVFIDALTMHALAKRPMIIEALKTKDPVEVTKAMIDSPIVTDDPKVDAVLENIKKQYLAGKSFDQIAKEAAERATNEDKSLLDEFKPDENGEVEL